MLLGEEERKSVEARQKEKECVGMRGRLVSFHFTKKVFPSHCHQAGAVRLLRFSLCYCRVLTLQCRVH